MKTIKILAIDLDNTLLRSDKSISDYTVSVLTRCAGKGVAVMYATARAERACERFLKRYTPDILLTNAGALAKVKGQTIYRAAMDVQTVDALIDTCVRSPSVGYITVETDGGYYVNHPIDPSHSGWADYIHALPFDFSREKLGCEAYKLTAEFSCIEAAQKAADAFDGVELTAFSGENWYRFARADATKWHGIGAIARHLGVCTEEIAAFGDDYSDIGMVMNCGHGVAMANAIEEVKREARYICASNDGDGVAHWIEDNVL